VSHPRLESAPEPERGPEWGIATRPVGRPAAGVAVAPAATSARPAPVWARLGAAVIDQGILSLPLVAVLLLGLRASRTPGGAWDLVSTLALICWVVGALLYSVVGGGEGQTLGKRVTGIVVVDLVTGRPIGYERALVRSVVLLVMVLPGCLGLLSVVTPGSDRHRGWHDRAARSVVVRGFLP
jgi:uncharacterized RDD family membrane protein YckC